ncbi:MAG: hypothetical protein ACRDJC_00345, partial [Thermomicrobiales bacterium]
MHDRMTEQRTSKGLSSTATRRAIIATLASTLVAALATIRDPAESVARRRRRGRGGRKAKASCSGQGGAGGAGGQPS